MATRLHERPASSSRDLAVACVDDALRGFARRELVTTDEARAALRGIAESIVDPVHAAGAVPIVEDAAASYGDSLLVFRGRVVDALLDLRLVLGS